jgi:hypothetical protein
MRKQWFYLKNYVATARKKTYQKFMQSMYFSAHPLNFSSVLTFDGHLQAVNKGLNLIRGYIAARRHYY